RPAANLALAPNLNLDRSRRSRLLTNSTLWHHLINTPFQRGDSEPGMARNRSKGFARILKTVRTVTSTRSSLSAQLKQGVTLRLGFVLLPLPLLGPLLRAQSGRRFLQTTLLIIAIAVIADGLLGPQVSSANLAGVLPWTYWRVIVVIALLAAGNFFCMACPFMLFRDLGRRLGLRQHSWPRVLRSKWLAIAFLVLFFWSYEVFSLWDKPIWTA